MTNEIDDGGPAYPQKEPTTSDCTGMSMRDYFAGLAMQGLMGRAWSDPVTGKNPDDIISIWAKSAYAVADAMLAARKGKP